MGELVFEGIRVLDFGQYVAGPAAAVMMADQGADVIRIDPPGGPRWDSPAADVLNRRKKSIVLDLKNPSDKDTAIELARTADVLIENFRPGVMERLGLGYEKLNDINPALLYLSLPGFAAEDKEYADIPAWEAVIAAACGQFTDMGLNRILMGINPSFSPVTLPSAYASVLGAFAVTSALYAREETGRGDHIEVPIASALMEGLVYNSMVVEDLPERYKSLREREIDRRNKENIPFNMKYDELQEFLDPFYRSYFCADGRPVYVVSSCHKNHAHKTLEVMGLLDEALKAGVPEIDDWYCSSRDWPDGVDCALGLYPMNPYWADWISRRMAARFREKTSFEWENLFGTSGVPVSAHLTTGEWLRSEHPRKAGLIQKGIHPGRKGVFQPGPVAWMADSSSFFETVPESPAPDTHRQEILKDLKERTPKKASPGKITERPWLERVKVLDMSNVIAGPMTGESLIRFGAEVIKLDPVNVTYDPWNTVLMGLQIHRGKKSLLADIKSEKGNEAFHRLLRWADVIIFNGPERQLKPLGLDSTSLGEIGSEAILCRLDAWGGPFEGPFSNFLGYDDLVQASTGIMSRFGGSIQTPEEHAHLGTIDVLTGFSAAFSVAMALFRKKRTGQIGIARTSLSALGQLLQTPFMYDFDEREPFNEAAGREAKGEGPLYRCYRSQDGWFFLGARSADLGKLEELTDFTGISQLGEKELADFLEAVFAGKPSDRWRKTLSGLDIAAVPLGALSELRERFGSTRPMNNRARGKTFQFTRYENHPGNLKIELVDSCSIRPRNAVLNVPPCAGKFGEDTVSVLKELGYGEKEIEEMLREGVVSEGWGAQYLPD